MAICDFDMRFTFVVSGWPGSAHDSRVFNDTLNRYSDEFPHPLEGLLLISTFFFLILISCLTITLCIGKYYLIDSGYPNRKGFLAHYKGQRYHVPEFQGGHTPTGRKEVFNHAHSSLHNVIERWFGVWKMKWCILLLLLSFLVEKQKKIIIACMALHNFIHDSDLSNQLFEMCDNDEEFPQLRHQKAAPIMVQQQMMEICVHSEILLQIHS
jgi:hypothetical protein